jgi:hypothetical protein
MSEKKNLMKSLINNGFLTALTVLILGVIVLIYVLI